MCTETIQQLREAEAKYRGLFESAVEGIYQSTADGRYLIVNAALARMYGYERREDLLNQVSDITNQIYIDPSLRDRFKKEIEAAGFVHGLEYQVRRKDGVIIWVSESARAVRDDTGAVCYYEGFIDNITARKQAELDRARLEKQMLHAQKMDAIGTLAGGIAHDFNNILCAILGYTELALFDHGIQGRSRENLQAVLKSAGRAQDLIKRILTFSRPTDYERRPIKLSAVLKEGVKLLHATLPSSVTISFAIKTEEDVVEADATEMHQIIMNLGTNAGHAMSSKGGLLDFQLDLATLETGAAGSPPAGPYVHLQVRDTGGGMSREVLDRIFEPFFTTKPAGQGTGLGLSLVQKIVSRTGGQIRVESEQGEGTIFHIYLPKSSLAPAPPKTGENQMLSGRREQILVVDDEIPVLSMMQQRLRRLGYRVTTRADGINAVETFRAEPHRFDLVITDHTMPGLQGSELAEQLGNIRADLPVILMTGLNQPPDLTASRYALRRAVLQKPINFVELSQNLRRFLDQKSCAS